MASSIKPPIRFDRLACNFLHACPGCFLNSVASSISFATTCRRNFLCVWALNRFSASLLSYLSGNVFNALRAILHSSSNHFLHGNSLRDLWLLFGFQNTSRATHCIACYKSTHVFSFMCSTRLFYLSTYACFLSSSILETTMIALLSLCSTQWHIQC